MSIQDIKIINLYKKELGDIIKQGISSRREAVREFDFTNYRSDYRTKPCPKPKKDRCLLEADKIKELQIFLNIPYFLHRQSFALSDCWGTARLFYAYHGWQFDIEEFYSVSEDFIKCDSLKLARYLKTNFHKTKNKHDLEYGDLIVYGRHVLIYLKEDLFIGQSHQNIELLSCSAAFQMDIDCCGKWTGYKRKHYCNPYTLSAEDRQIIKINQINNPYLIDSFTDKSLNLEVMAYIQMQVASFYGYPTELAYKLTKEARFIAELILNKKMLQKSN